MTLADLAVDDLRAVPISPLSNWGVVADLSGTVVVVLSVVEVVTPDTDELSVGNLTGGSEETVKTTVDEAPEVAEVEGGDTATVVDGAVDDGAGDKGAGDDATTVVLGTIEVVVSTTAEVVGAIVATPTLLGAVGSPTTVTAPEPT